MTLLITPVQAFVNLLRAARSSCSPWSSFWALNHQDVENGRLDATSGGEQLSPAREGVHSQGLGEPKSTSGPPSDSAGSSGWQSLGRHHKSLTDSSLATPVGNRARG